MGMYTEFHFNTRLKGDTPKDVIHVLKYMVGISNVSPSPMPKHEFFKCDRWRFLFTMDSYYFDSITHSILEHDDILEGYVLSVRSNLKNYGGEIEKFLSFIWPYIEKADDELLGFKRYEEDEEPTLIFYKR